MLKRNGGNFTGWSYQICFNLRGGGFYCNICQHCLDYLELILVPPRPSTKKNNNRKGKFMQTFFCFTQIDVK